MIHCPFLCHSPSRRPDDLGRGTPLPRALTLVLVLSAAFGPAARAVPLAGVPVGDSYLNVEDAEPVGTGPEVTYVVIDFRAGGGASFAFSYEHDGMDTPQDMLVALDDAGILNVHLEDFSFGSAVRGIEYPREGQAEVFATALEGERSWYLWDGRLSAAGVDWSPADVGINGQPFNPEDPVFFLPDGGFYGLTTSPEFPGSAPLVPIPGDFDSSGVVDGGDLLDAVLGFGTSAGPTLAAGDADRNGVVNRADILLWRENVGAGLSGPGGTAAASVPEPGTLATACLAGLVFLRLARGRSPA